MHDELRAIRVRAGISQLKAAAETDTSIPLVRLYELSGGQGVVHPTKRAALENYYASLATERASQSPPSAA